MFENIDLFQSVIQLRDGGVAEPRERPGVVDLGRWTIAAIHADDSSALHPDVWERHPSGSEVLCVLTGEISVYLRDEGDGGPVTTLTAGRAFIVPEGRWHRLTVGAPADLLAVTPRAETQHERVDADEHRAEEPR